MSSATTMTGTDHAKVVARSHLQAVSNRISEGSTETVEPRAQNKTSQSNEHDGI